MNFEKTYGTYDLTTLAQWFEHEDGGSFFIAPLNNNKQLEETMKLTKVNDDINQKTLYETKEVSCKVLSKAILLDWKGVTDNKGKALKYSAENGEKVLLRYNEFTNWIITQARELSESKETKKAEEIKN